MAVSDDPDLIGAVEFATVHARAILGSSVPVVRLVEIFRPEGPGAALLGAYRVDYAQCFSLAIAVQEDAVVPVTGM